ncbi:hypothetical protein F2Q70_00027268 [Brassica cretica]|uniref:Uncharacterized protein n=1 Tax=Brassica cretica TaxID=69181 RepID=A0A8S9L3Q3_BRACR|nr:hypothetical protein F2Q70_00027268 [Brassica cretica]
MFRPTKIVGIVDVRDNRRELSVENFRRLGPSESFDAFASSVNSDAFASSVNSDALFPSVISEELSVGNVVAREIDVSMKSFDDLLTLSSMSCLQVSHLCLPDYLVPPSAAVHCKVSPEPFPLLPWKGCCIKPKGLGGGLFASSRPVSVGGGNRITSFFGYVFHNVFPPRV